MHTSTRTTTTGPSSFRAKSAWLSLITILVAFGTYFVRVLPAGGETTTSHVVTLAVVVFVFVSVQVAGHRILATAFAEDARRTPSASERSAELRAHRIAYYVLTIGVFAAFALALGAISSLTSPFWLSHTVLLFFVLAELTKYAAQLVLYRRTDPSLAVR